MKQIVFFDEDIINPRRTTMHFAVAKMSCCWRRPNVGSRCTPQKNECVLPSEEHTSTVLMEKMEPSPLFSWISTGQKADQLNDDSQSRMDSDDNN
ncbi:hypothetical protein CAEBREN_12906 [Caenorhabditis brenneri]|uniref:Uncharacterized protein n=1 Tax=Caenorhabditis brenneri TaxID=135651 RepID=G0P518_CAEBE|nr:hypothetical protein CAEBREN_12906 [Caenorhabditis brenneri]